MDVVTATAQIAGRRPLSTLEWLVASVLDRFPEPPDEATVALVTGLGDPGFVTRGLSALGRAGCVTQATSLATSALTDTGRTCLTAGWVPEKPRSASATIAVDALTERTLTDWPPKDTAGPLTPVVALLSGPRPVGRERMESCVNMDRQRGEHVVDVVNGPMKRSFAPVAVQIRLSRDGVVFAITEGTDRATWLEQQELPLEDLAPTEDGGAFGEWAADVGDIVLASQITGRLREAIAPAEGSVLATERLVEEHGLRDALVERARKGVAVVVVSRSYSFERIPAEGGRIGFVVHLPAPQFPDLLVTNTVGFRRSAVRTQGVLGSTWSVAPMVTLHTAAFRRCRVEPDWDPAVWTSELGGYW